MPDNNTVTIATPYEDLLRKILAEGTHKNDRTGTGTTSLFAQQLRFDLAESFPLITTKQVHFHSVVGGIVVVFVGVVKCGVVAGKWDSDLERVGG